MSLGLSHGAWKWSDIGEWKPGREPVLAINRLGRRLGSHSDSTQCKQREPPKAEKEKEWEKERERGCKAGSVERNESTSGGREGRRWILLINFSWGACALPASRCSSCCCCHGHCHRRFPFLYIYFFWLFREERSSELSNGNAWRVMWKHFQHTRVKASVQRGFQRLPANSRDRNNSSTSNLQGFLITLDFTMCLFNFWADIN